MRAGFVHVVPRLQTSHLSFSKLGTNLEGEMGFLMTYAVSQARTQAVFCMLYGWRERYQIPRRRKTATTIIQYIA